MKKLSISIRVAQKHILRYADIYKSANAALAIEKLEQLKAQEPSNTAVDKKLAEIYYLKNDFSKAAEAYSRFAMGPTATEEDLVKYAFALFLNHDFEKSLEVANMGLKRMRVTRRSIAWQCIIIQT